MAAVVAQLVDKATSADLLVEDWGTNMDICDYASTSAGSADETMRTVLPKLASRNPKVQVLALTLLDGLVKNGTAVVIQAASAAHMVAALSSLCKDGNEDVQAKAAELVQTLGHALASSPGAPWKAAYDRLKGEGVAFPPVDESAVSAIRPAPAPPAAAAPAVGPASPATALPVGLGSGPSPYGGRAHNMHGQGAAAAAAIDAAGGAPPPGIIIAAPGSSAVDAAAAGASPAAAGGGGVSAPDPVAVVEAMDRAFGKLRGDLGRVRANVAALARLLLDASTAAPTNEGLLDTVDFLQQCAPRLGDLVEAGVAGIIQDERLFDDCLSTNEAVARVLEHGAPIAALASDAGNAARLAAFVPRGFPALADLADFDADTTGSGGAGGRPAAAVGGSGGGAGAVDSRGAPIAGAISPATTPVVLPSATAAHDDLLSLFAAGPAPATAAAAPVAPATTAAAATLASGGRDPFAAPPVPVGTRSPAAPASPLHPPISSASVLPPAATLGGGAALGARASPAAAPAAPAAHQFNPFDDAASASGGRAAAPAADVSFADFEAPAAPKPPAPVAAASPAAAAVPAAGASGAGGSQSVLAELDDILNS